MADAPKAGRLLLVATPIGNLGDLSPRAVEALAGAALVCCEDTRRTGRLLQHAGIAAARLAVANEHTEARRIEQVLSVLAAGGDVAVVTDAGTPGISDPGERLVGAAVDAGFAASTVPGPTAFVAALVASGLPTSRFVFEGFLPRTGRPRAARLAEIAAEPRTVVLYEAPHRVLRTVSDLAAACGSDRPVVVGRELTKLHEELVRGTLGDIDLGDPRGEYVIVMSGVSEQDEAPDDATIRAAVDAERAAGRSNRDAVTSVAERLGVAKRRVYAVAVGTLGGGRTDPPDPLADAHE